MLAEIGSEEQDHFLLEQQFRYTYASPIRWLRHRLVVVPPARHGSQCRVDHGLAVSGDPARIQETTDTFNNHVVEVRASAVAASIEFNTWALVRCRSSAEFGDALPALTDLGPLLEATPLTQANEGMTQVTRDLSAASSGGLDLAERFCAWSFEALTYQYGITGVHTDAASALAGGKGVCQDYAHVMLALCRAAGLPARYVSGHLVGEGGSHAWVEVIVNDRSATTGQLVAVAFDPTHNRRAGQDYLTVAVGRDYAHVAPTSGTFEGDCPGVLTTNKRLGRISTEVAQEFTTTRRQGSLAI